MTDDSNQCNLRVDNPHVSERQRKLGNLTIDAKARVECDMSPGTHLVTMTLERLVSGTWLHRETSDPDQRIPGPGKPLTYMVAVNECVPGRWRATATAQGKLKGKPFHFTDEKQSDIPKAKCEVGR
ncbi:hypothetical protein [Herbihabitans rhizosphaerae]|nr:hypothetical protein [Herbihabitans rhizosphaerae]